MGLPWVRLDCAFPRNPKLLALLGEKDGHRAALAYLCSLAYSGEQGTDGFVPREALPFIHARLSDAALLARYGLWVKAGQSDGGCDAGVTPGVTGKPGYPQAHGWVIHGWAEFQESTPESQQRRKRAQAAAAARWNGHEAVSAAERQRRYRGRRLRGRDDAHDLRKHVCDDACDDAELRA